MSASEVSSTTSLSLRTKEVRFVRRRRSPCLLMGALSALLATSSPLTPPSIAVVDAFGATETATAFRTKTSLRFRNHHQEGFATSETASAVMAREPFLHHSLEMAPITPISSSPQQQLPVWLSARQAPYAERNLDALRKAMRLSFFTDNESLRLTAAIQEAASGDRNKVAGAAEFCLLLVETMELGLTALVAAAFHYCSCVSARERHADASSPFISSAFLSHSTAELEGFGQHCVDIAADAARLKRLESVAAVIVHNHAQPVSSRVHPDRHDAENLRCLLLSETKDWRALAIRSAACLFRLRGIARAHPGKLTLDAVRTSREALYIYAPLASRLGMHRLKNELEGAAFRILYPRQYAKVNVLSAVEHSPSHHNSIGESMQHVLMQIKSDVTAMLEKDPEFMNLVQNFSVTARVKEPYSMWKKMLDNGHRSVLQVPDLLALRVILQAKKLSPDEPTEVTRARERALCYYVQKLCTAHWQPDPRNGRFKDYVDRPKANGYQSLHYTALTRHDGADWNVEFQVRSSEMHHVAEFGFASHWEYKMQKHYGTAIGSGAATVNDVTMRFADDNVDHSSEAYLRNLQQWHWQHLGGAAKLTQQRWDAAPASFEPFILSDIWQSRARATAMQARTEKLEPYLAALTAAQSDLARDFVFVFMTSSSTSSSLASSSSPTGTVMALPSGSCVWDAIRKASGVWGDATLSSSFTRDVERAVSLNGASCSMTRRLMNGDILAVPRVTAVTAAALAA